MEGKGQKEWSTVRVREKRQKSKGRRERIIGTSNGANAERNATRLELSNYMKTRFSSYINKLKFSCH